MSGFKWGGVRIPTTRPHQPLASGGHLRRPGKIRHASCALLCHPAEAVCLNNSSVVDGGRACGEDDAGDGQLLVRPAVAGADLL